MLSSVSPISPAILVPSFTSSFMASSISSSPLIKTCPVPHHLHTFLKQSFIYPVTSPNYHPNSATCDITDIAIFPSGYVPSSHYTIYSLPFTIWFFMKTSWKFLFLTSFSFAYLINIHWPPTISQATMLVKWMLSIDNTQSLLLRSSVTKMNRLLSLIILDSSAEEFETVDYPS